MSEDRIFLGRPYVMGGETRRTTEEDELAATKLSLEQVTQEYDKLRKAVRHMRETNIIDDGGMEALHEFAKTNESFALILDALEGK